MHRTDEPATPAAVSARRADAGACIRIHAEVAEQGDVVKRRETIVLRRLE
jgi:hypothetical protein